MKRSAVPTTLPAARPLRVFAFDPSHRRHLGNHLTVRVPYEPLRPGPIGQRIAVYDYDASNDCYYEPVDLDHPSVLLQQGLEPSETNPQFHQQMAYAVAWETASLFERALGRPVRWRFRRFGEAEATEQRHLRIFPHAIQTANAYYDRRLGALIFGYFAATDGHPVFSVLSHDIIAHETTHALLDVLRDQYIFGTNPDVQAFHEAFADLVALFQHFSVKEALLETVQRTGGHLHRLATQPDVRAEAGPSLIQAEIPGTNPLIQLAKQFGESLGNRAALRSALGVPPIPDALPRAVEPHARGAILVAAMFDAFFTIYLRRTRDLMRIARAAGAVLDAGELHPDLAARLAGAAAKTASHFVNICVRALDYCPPMDITFGDFLRALLTADYETVPEDRYAYRDALIQAFAARGIRPGGVVSLSEESLRWEPLESARAVRALDVSRLMIQELEIDRLRATEGESAAAKLRGVHAKRRLGLEGFAKQYASFLGLRSNRRIRVGLLSRSLRPSQDGIVRPEFVATFYQAEHHSLAEHRRSSQGFMFSGGCTVLIDFEGTVRYVIAKPLRDTRRLASQRAHFAHLLEEDVGNAYTDPDGMSSARLDLDFRLDFSLLHRGY